MPSFLYYTIKPDEAQISDSIEETGQLRQEQYQAAYEHLIVRQLPACLNWCGNQLLGECIGWENGQPVLSYEDSAALYGFELGGGFAQVCRDAWDELRCMSEEEVLGLLGDDHQETVESPQNRMELRGFDDTLSSATLTARDYNGQRTAPQQKNAVKEK